MRSFIRFFLWLSITVLSLQGGAAMACGQAETAAHATVLASAHRHHQDTAHAGAGHCGKAAAKTAASSHGKCSACASCCVGAAALPVRLPTFHAPSSDSSLPAIAQAAMTSVVPAALERPPRASFA
ncbi:hypothetical protein [Massilia putida]|uniref:hypothetical protein n=1 Tax=Massilia putida TaxID=1141883 RepID=UPI000951F214|nr:hypothetical protein [Massilia putida]